MATLDCRATHLSLVQPPTADLAAFVLEQDAIYVGGGNTRSLLALWREWGLDVALRAAYERGTVLGGISAGMICWFEYGITDSVPGALSPLRCLGWLPGTACPHYDGEAERRPAFHRLLAEGAVPAGYAADDGAALHFVDDAARARGVARPAARAMRERVSARARASAARDARTPLRLLDCSARQIARGRASVERTRALRSSALHPSRSPDALRPRGARARAAPALPPRASLRASSTGFR